MSPQTSVGVTLRIVQVSYEVSGFFFVCLFFVLVVESFYENLYLFVKHLRKLNPLHPKISTHRLHTLLHTFPVVLIRRICK